MTKLNEIQNIVEENDYKLEQAGAILGSVRDMYEEVVETSKTSENKEYMTYHVLGRVQKRMGIMFDMLDNLLLDTTEKNTELVKQILELNKQDK